MTAPAEQKEKTAAVLFAGFMALALGGAGLLVAALAVGIERAVAGETVEQQRSRQRRRGWLAEQRAWLGADHDRRLSRTEARRAWLEAGGAPEAKPAEPGRARRFGAGLRRLIARTAVGVSDFAAGAKDGWQAGEQTRRQGGGFRDIAGSRPGPAEPPAESPAAGVCSNCKRPGVPIAAAGLCADCEAVFRPRQQPPPAGAQVDLSWTCKQCPATGTGYTSDDEMQADAQRHFDTAHGAGDIDQTGPESPADEHPQPTPADDPAGIPAGPDEGETMTDRTPDRRHRHHSAAGPTPPARQAPATESNATVLRAQLQTAQATLHRIADLTDKLASERGTLDGQVTRAEEFAQATGQTTQCRQALDESKTVSTQMGARLGEFSQNAVSAEEQMAQAADGLKVAEQAEDSLHASGADGRAVAPAGANA